MKLSKDVVSISYYINQDVNIDWYEAQEKWLYLMCKAYTSDQLCYVTFKKPHFSSVLMAHSLKTEIYFVPRLELMCCIFPHLLGNIFQKAQNILSPHKTRIVV